MRSLCDRTFLNYGLPRTCASCATKSIETRAFARFRHGASRGVSPSRVQMFKRRAILERAMRNILRRFRIRGATYGSEWLLDVLSSLARTICVIKCGAMPPPVAVAAPTPGDAPSKRRRARRRRRNAWIVVNSANASAVTRKSQGKDIEYVYQRARIAAPKIYRIGHVSSTASASPRSRRGIGFPRTRSARSRRTTSERFYRSTSVRSTVYDMRSSCGIHRQLSHATMRDRTVRHCHAKFSRSSSSFFVAEILSQRRDFRRASILNDGASRARVLLRRVTDR